MWRCSAYPASAVWRSATLKRMVCVVAPSTALHTNKASLFTNAKQSYGHDREEKLKNPDPSIFDTADSTSAADIPSAAKVEKVLPSLKQLNDELPSAAEVEAAIKRGDVKDYVTPSSEDVE